MNVWRLNEPAVAELKEAIKGDNKTVIETKTKALTDASSKMAERLYANQDNPWVNNLNADAGAGKADEGVVVMLSLKKLKTIKIRIRSKTTAAVIPS